MSNEFTIIHPRANVLDGAFDFDAGGFCLDTQRIGLHGQIRFLIVRRHSHVADNLAFWRAGRLEPPVVAERAMMFGQLPRSSPATDCLGCDSV